MKLAPIVLLSVSVGLVACTSENNQPTIEKQTDVSFPSVPLIDIYNDKLLVESAKAKVIEKSQSIDTENNPKIIYQFNKIFSQIEISKNQIIITWTNSEESDNMKKISSESQKNASNILVAIFGEAGKQLLSTESKPIEDKLIAGLRVGNVSCISGLCSIKIYR